MNKNVALLAGCFLVAGQQAAQAATFTPDMWVYEVNLKPESLDYPIFAFADAPLGTVAPVGCTAFDVPDVPEGETPYTTISCPGGGPVDPIEEIGGLEQFAKTGRIGFNSSSIVCDGDLLIGCPENEQDTSAGIFGFFLDTVLDAHKGELSYCGIVGFSDFSACYTLSPALVTVSGVFGSSSPFGNVGGRDGVWEFGFGGIWRSQFPDNYVRYSGSGQLLLSPVPVPAPALMLGSAILAVGALGIRRSRSRRSSRL